MMRRGGLGRGVILRHDLYEDYDLWCIMAALGTARMGYGLLVWDL